MLVKDIEKNGFTGLKWSDDHFDKPDFIPFSETKDVSIEIERYIGLRGYIYSSVYQCLLYDWTYINRLPFLWDELVQFFFSRRDLGLTDRIETLGCLVQKSIDEPDYAITEVNLPKLLHGPRYFLHPDRKRQQNYAKFILASFKSTGELEEKNGVYKITGKALETLSSYETERKRHDQILAQSRHMKWLTFALILVGALNALVACIAANGTGT